MLDAIEEGEEFDNVAEIAIEPPEVRTETDEDSGDEDLDPGSANRLTGFQMRARAHLLRRNRDSDSDNSDDEAQTQTAQVQTQSSTSKRRKKSAAYLFHRVSNCPSGLLPIFPPSNYSAYRDMNPVELFELFWDELLIENILDQMKLYSIWKGKDVFVSSKAEFRTFLGIVMLSGYNKLPQRKLYWSHDSDVGNDLVKSSMRKNKFEQIMQFLHFTDNSALDVNDRYCKLRPLITHLQKNFGNHFIPQQYLSHDEALIEYFGRNSLKQHIIQKPIRFGYECFCLNTPSGYLIAFDFYQGRKGNYDVALAEEFGKNAATVLALLRYLPENLKDLAFHISMDNRFTSFPLFSKLKEIGYEATGTIRKNKVEKKCQLVPIKEMKKSSKRGDICAAVGRSTDRNEEVKLVRWKDNNIVTVCSTVFGTEPIKKVQRWSRIEKKKIDVDRPYIVERYNKTMGGTDRQDQHVNNYRSGIRGKKWWFPLFTWLVDVSIQNAWLLGREANCKDCDNLLTFRRSIAIFYLKHYGSEQKRPGRRSSMAPAETELRFDRMDHFVLRNEGNARRRCAHCGSRSVYGCKKCDRGLSPSVLSTTTRSPKQKNS